MVDHRRTDAADHGDGEPLPDDGGSDGVSDGVGVDEDGGSLGVDEDGGSLGLDGGGSSAGGSFGRGMVPLLGGPSPRGDAGRGSGRWRTPRRGTWFGDGPRSRAFASCPSRGTGVPCGRFSSSGIAPG